MSLTDRLRRIWEDNSREIGCLLLFLGVVAAIALFSWLVWSSEVRKTREEYAKFGDGFIVEFLRIDTDRTGTPTNTWVPGSEGHEVTRYMPSMDPRITRRILVFNGVEGPRLQWKYIQDVPDDTNNWLWVRPPYRSERNWEFSPGQGQNPRLIIEVHLHKGELPQSAPGQHKEGKHMVED